MPSTYAHYRFGANLLPTMPGDVRRTIQRFRRLYDVGLHGPDIFYYNILPVNSTVRFLGSRYHEQTGKEFFQRICRAVRLEKSEAAQAYLYGLLSHYCLDALCHPFIQEQADAGVASHFQIEAEFERFLLESDGKVPACAQDLSPHLRLTPGEWETVARLYSPVSPRAVRDSLQNMARFTKLLSAPPGARRAVVSSAVALFGKELTDMMIPEEPNPKCTHLNEAIMARYHQAQELFPGMLSQLQAHMTYSAPFDAEFLPIFG